jgi:hypothetical protein
VISPVLSVALALPPPALQDAVGIKKSVTHEASLFPATAWAPIPGTRFALATVDAVINVKARIIFLVITFFSMFMVFPLLIIIYRCSEII